MSNRVLTREEVEIGVERANAALREVGHEPVGFVAQDADGRWYAGFPAGTPLSPELYRAGVLAVVSIDSPSRMVPCFSHWRQHGGRSTCRLPAAAALRWETCEVPS